MKEIGKHIFALGVGHNTPVFIELAEACGYEVVGLYHYNNERNGEYDHGILVLGSFEDLFSNPTLKGREFLLTMGDNRIRAELSDKIRALGGTVPSLIHPTAIISRFADVSTVGVYISPFVHVQADVSIGDNTVLLSHVDVSHTSRIGCNCFIAGGCTVGAYTTIDDNVFMGQGSLTVSGKVRHVGRNSYIGACSLITKDIEENVVVMGMPAKVIRNISD